MEEQTYDVIIDAVDDGWQARVQEFPHIVVVVAGDVQDAIDVLQTKIQHWLVRQAADVESLPPPIQHGEDATGTPAVGKPAVTIRLPSPGDA